MGGGRRGFRRCGQRRLGGGGLGFSRGFRLRLGGSRLSRRLGLELSLRPGGGGLRGLLLTGMLRRLSPRALLRLTNGLSLSRRSLSRLSLGLGLRPSIGRSLSLLLRLRLFRRFRRLLFAGLLLRLGYGGGLRLARP